MKNRLLALMALCGATSSTLPLWAAWEAPELQFVDPNLATDGTGGGVYYIYHVATQKFMVNGADYNTRLIVADEGKEVTLSYGEDYELSRRPESDAEYSTAKGWRLSMMEGHTNSGMHEFYITNSGADVFVDHNKQGHILWQIMPQDGNVYRIKVIDEDKIYGAEVNGGAYKNSYMAVNTGSTKVFPLVDNSTEGYQEAEPDWKFVKPEVYEIFQAKKKLKVQLESADEIGFKDYAEYAALYNSEEATAEELLEAVENLKSDIIDFGYSVATEENPIDVTERFVKEPSFANSTDGWDIVQTTGSGINYQLKTGDRFENAGSLPEGIICENFYECSTSNGSNMPNWSITQKIEGLVDGKYRVGAWILTNRMPTEDEPKSLGLYLSAKTLAEEVRVAADKPAEAGNENRGNGTWHYYTADFEVIGGTATIGYVVENANSTWSAVDNFDLKYMGPTGEANIRELLNKNIESAEAQYAEYTNANKAFSNSEKTKYENIIATAKEAAQNPSLDDETLTGIITSLLARMDTLSMDVAGYDALNQKIEDLNKAYNETPYADKGLEDYEIYLDEVLQVSYDERTFDVAELDSIQPRADRIYREAVKKALMNGDTDNVTGMLANPSFTGSKDGWSYKYVSGDNKFNYGYNMGEVYSTVCDVYQELDGMPTGTYEVTLQGFYRPTWNGTCAEAWGLEGDTTNDILGYAFGNDTKAELCHVFECLQDTNTVNNCEQLLVGGSDLEGKWVANGMASAAAIMEANPEAYLVSFKCYVEEDGKLRVGITIPNAGLAGYWALFDNFQIKYLGAGDVSGAEGTLNALIEEATKLLNSEGVTTIEAKDGLNSTIQAATKAIEDGLNMDSYKENKTALSEAIEAGEKAQKAASEFETLVTEYLNNFDLGVYDEYIDTPEFGTFQDLLYDEMEPAMEAPESVTWIENAIARINEAYAKMKATSMDMSKANIDEPFDATGLMQSPSFSELDPESDEEVASTKGWITAEGNNEDATSALNYEFIVGKGDADIHQILYALPKGYYRLVYNGFYRAGLAVDAALARRDSTDAQNAEVYVEAGEGKWSKPLASILDGVSELKYDVNDVLLPDSLFPESGMLYHFVVDNVNGVKGVFDEGMYEGNFSFYVSEDGQPVTIGVRKEEAIPNDWAIFDNFRLYYYGDGDTNKPGDFTDNIEDVTTGSTESVVRSEWYTLNGVRVSEPKQRGIYIRQDEMSDGTKKTVKVLVK
ncbi:MAG: hypothetical protein UC662_15555 [Paraprevotella clara]|nr:hypothetical protein [Paraprevotella clara]